MPGLTAPGVTLPTDVATPLGAPIGGYGIRLRERDGNFPTNINVVKNFFFSELRPDWAFVLGTSPDDAPQPYPGQVFIGDNHLPPENLDPTGTDAAGLTNTEIAIPAQFRVTEFELQQFILDCEIE